MAMLTSGRCLAGSKAFTGVRPRQVSVVANGSKVFMKRKDTYMVEVNVGEDEPEDIAVRKFMKKVMDSRVIEQLRARRYKETPLMTFKRRTRERIEKIKMKVVEPTWEEEYGMDVEVKPFADFFPSPDDVQANFLDVGFLYGNDEFLSTQGGYLTDAGVGSTWGSYQTQPNARFGSYMGSVGGGYMDQSAGFAGGYSGYTQPADAAQQAPPQEGGFVN